MDGRSRELAGPAGLRGRASECALLDELVAHLDPGRRTALYEALRKLDAQVWMTGADPAAFAEIASQADMFAVTPGSVARQS